MSTEISEINTKSNVEYTKYRVKDPYEFLYSDWVYKDSTTLHYDSFLTSYDSPDEYKRVNDKRRKHQEFKSNHGYEKSEAWSLYTTIAKFVYPRLKTFRQDTNGYPTSLGSIDNWHDVLDKMLLAFALVIDEDNCSYSNEEYKMINEGMNLFAKYFMNLWW